jgi:hypothetical protein
MRIVPLGMLTAVLVLASTPADACSRAGEPNIRETRQSVDRALSASAAIIDAVVERANGPYNTPEEWAVLRTVRIWKGPKQAYFKVVAPTSCSVEFSEKEVGQTVRVVLWGGPEFYTMSQTRQPRVFDRLLKRRLKNMKPYLP